MKQTLPILLTLLLWPAAPALRAQDIDETVLPRQTEIFIELGRTINSRTARAGDKFFGTVTVPVTYEDRIVIPQGSYILGKVVKAKRSGRITGKSQLQVVADTVILPSGLTRKLVTVLTSADGLAGGREIGEQGEIEKEGSQTGEVAGGAGKGAVGLGTIGVLTGSASRAAQFAAAGAAAGALLSLFKRGEDVVLAKGSTITVLLEESVGFEKPQPPQGRLLGKDDKSEKEKDPDPDDPR
ncbi:MAG TPA: hypothetical protein VLV83_23475 [Acidobacteriota bacterium]|nr:hypothetical protein [Acidobacteriota bacterium]